jgi:hypothetical protein
MAIISPARIMRTTDGLPLSVCCKYCGSSFCKLEWALSSVSDASGMVGVCFITADSRGVPRKGEITTLPSFDWEFTLANQRSASSFDDAITDAVRSMRPKSGPMAREVLRSSFLWS